MGDDPVTKQDLVSQLALHKSVISSELQKSQEAASAALSASNSLKEQSEIKFNHTGNERNFRFNGQVLAKLVSLKDHLADLASVLGNSHSRPLPLRQSNTFPQLTTHSPEGLVDIAVLQATGGRSARSVSQGFTSAAHLASCQPVPQAPLIVPEYSFMASLQQEASGALGVHHSASHCGLKGRDVNARLEEEFADLLSQDKYCFGSEYEQCISSRGFEYKQGSAPIVYKDRFRSKVDCWVSIGSSPWVLSIIRFGYRIPFISWPPRAFFL